MNRSVFLIIAFISGILANISFVRENNEAAIFSILFSVIALQFCIIFEVHELIEEFKKLKK